MFSLIFKLVVKQNRYDSKVLFNYDDQTDLDVERRLLLDKRQYTLMAGTNRRKEDKKCVPMSSRPIQAKINAMTATDDGHFCISVVSD